MGYIKEQRSVLGNLFVSIDGEGFENDSYGLLDSSYDGYPGLYTGERLTSLQCLDWLWGLGKAVGYAKAATRGSFVMYGARYDFDNWMRDLESLEAVKAYAAGDMVRIGPYAVVWMKGYKFEIRKVASEKPFKYERINLHDPIFGNRTDQIGLTFWDTQPFWQTTFLQALKDTLGDEAIDDELLQAGKEARGSFRFADSEWVRRYNKAEVYNHVAMMNRLDEWFASVNIMPGAYNGPGAAAKAMLRQYRPYEHAGRRMMSGKPRDYVFPGWSSTEGIAAARSAYAGGRNQILQLGFAPGSSYNYDINSAYPHASVTLPCLTHGRWKRTLDFDPSSFGLWKIRYKASTDMPFYPFFFRTDDGSIVYPAEFREKWVYTCELEGGLAIDPSGICIKEGRVWVPEICDNERPFWWVAKLGEDRLAYKRAGQRGPATALKLPLNSLYGSIAQARGSSGFTSAPWSQQLLWAGWITACTRTRLYLAACLAPTDICHMATDGLISRSRLPLVLGSELGQWEESTLTDLSLVQYGVYFSDTVNRWRGFRLEPEEISSFVSNIHEAWQSPWRSLPVLQRLFVTSSLVANGQRKFSEWCTWEDASRTLNLDVDTPYEQGRVQSLDRLYRVTDMSRYYDWRLLDSHLYSPKWGEGSGFPWEERDSFDEAFATAVTA